MSDEATNTNELTPPEVQPLIKEQEAIVSSSVNVVPTRTLTYKIRLPDDTFTELEIRKPTRKEAIELMAKAEEFFDKSVGKRDDKKEEDRSPIDLVDEIAELILNKEEALKVFDIYPALSMDIFKELRENFACDITMVKQGLAGFTLSIKDGLGQTHELLVNRLNRRTFNILLKAAKIQLEFLNILTVQAMISVEGAHMSEANKLANDFPFFAIDLGGFLFKQMNEVTFEVKKNP